jgi:hypothetical protein
MTWKGLYTSSRDWPPQGLATDKVAVMVPAEPETIHEREPAVMFTAGRSVT